MCVVRDYKFQDFNKTAKLMNIMSDLVDIEFDEDSWKHMAKFRAFSPQFRTLIAEDDGCVIGMCFADVHRDETGQFHGIIRNVIVDPEFRNKGVASRLITEAVKLFVDLKVHSIRVQVLEQIKEVIHLFEKFDFRCTAIMLEKDVQLIREYKESDYEATKELMQIYSNLLRIQFDEEEWKQTLKLRLRNPQYYILISEKEKEVTGMALIHITKDETGLTIGNLENVIVHPRFRGQGFGKSLLIRGIEMLNVLNVDKIRIFAHLKMKDYVNTFEEVGFKKSAYVMEIKLPTT
ncbi:MAG: GNAT family N-acetyltransferase [Promethearchaeota archaeon]|nr:MAG: GNAT family N-acetyltransferase [Candidatus Lokiarchaeota archaeon]